MVIISPRTWQNLAELQFRRAAAFLSFTALLFALSLPFVQSLDLDSSWAALLPEDKPSVRDLRAIEGRIAGLGTLTIAVESGDPSAMKRFARDLSDALEALPADLVRYVDWSVTAFQDFVNQNSLLYAEKEELGDVRDALGERLDYEKGRANPFVVDLLEEEPPDLETVIHDLSAKSSERRPWFHRFPDGFYIHPDGDLLVIFIRSDISGDNLTASLRLQQAVEREIERLKPSGYAPDLTVRITGELVQSRQEHAAIVQELLTATVLAVSLILLAMYLFFGEWLALPLLGLALLTPVTVTFALAEVLVGTLNTSTAFLGSIVVGNGVNPNIIWLARYMERRRSGASVTQAVQEAHSSTWIATVTASAAAGLAYGSLVLTDFRGFRDFGIIGGIGMGLCWLGAYLILPCLVVMAERIPRFSMKLTVSRSLSYGSVFSTVVSRCPRLVLAFTFVYTAVASLLVGRAVLSDPIEYNFRNLRSVRQKAPELEKLAVRIDETVGRSHSGDAVALLLPRRSDGPFVQREIETLRDEAGAPIGAVRSIEGLLPSFQEEKIALIEEIRSLAIELRRFASPEQKKKIDENMPPENLEPLTGESLPAIAALPFTEKDGTRGRILFVGPKEGRSVWDGRYLIEWARALRTLRNDDHDTLPLAGRAPIFAELLESVWDDGPKAVLASFLATSALLLLAFRRRVDQLLTWAGLLLGILWMASVMILLGMKLNFLNFVAFPITFGNGVDYGVNLMRRIRQEKQRATPSSPISEPVILAVRETGGAVILCSLTTSIGYASLYQSANLAINSFGSAMIISEITCVLAAVLVLPAAFLVMSANETTPTEITSIGH